MGGADISPAHISFRLDRYAAQARRSGNSWGYVRMIAHWFA